MFSLPISVFWQRALVTSYFWKRSDRPTRSSLSTIRNTCPAPSTSRVGHQGAPSSLSQSRASPHPLPEGWAITRSSAWAPEGWSEGHHLAPFAPGSEGGSQGKLARELQKAEKCTPKQKVRQKPTLWQAHVQVKFTAATEGRGVPSQKGAYFEVRERNRVF